MSRGLSTAFKDYVASRVLHPAYFVKLGFADESVRLWSGTGDITFGSETYVGTGLLGQVSRTEETYSTIAKGITLSLVGQGSGIYAAAMKDSKQMQGRPAWLWVAFMNEDFDTIQHDYLLNKYFMDTMTVEDVFEGDQGGIRISIKCESELVDMFNPSTAYYSNADQKALYPGDTFFRFISTLPGKDLKWAEKGAKTTQSTSGGGPGGSPGAGWRGLP